VVLIWGLASVSVAFLAHVLIWRISPPRNSGVALIRTFVGTFVVLTALGLLAAKAGADIMPGGVMEYIHVLVFYVALMCGYIMTYPAIEVKSPSLTIVDMIADAGSDGLPVERLYERLDDDNLLWPRVNDLVGERAVIFDRGFYRLTAKGRFIARVFTVFRGMLGAAKKGG